MQPLTSAFRSVKPVLASELIGFKADVVVAHGVLATLVAKKACATTPKSFASDAVMRSLPDW